MEGGRYEEEKADHRMMEIVDSLLNNFPLRRGIYTGALVPCMGTETGFIIPWTNVLGE